MGAIQCPLHGLQGLAHVTNPIRSAIERHEIVECYRAVIFFEFADEEVAHQYWIDRATWVELGFNPDVYIREMDEAEWEAISKLMMPVCYLCAEPYCRLL